MATFGACLDFQHQLNTIGGFATEQNVFDKTGGYLTGNLNGYSGNGNNGQFHPPTGNTVQDIVNAYRAAQTPKRDFVPIHEPQQEPPNNMRTFPPYQAKEMQASFQVNVMPHTYQAAAPQQQLQAYNLYTNANVQVQVKPQRTRPVIPVVQVPKVAVKPDPSTPISYQYSATKYSDSRKPKMFTHSNAFGENSGKWSIGQHLTLNQGTYPLKDITYDQFVTVPNYGQQASTINYGNGVHNGHGDFISKPENGEYNHGYVYNLPVLQNTGKNVNSIGYQLGDYASKVSYAPYSGHSGVNALTNNNNDFSKNYYSKKVNGFNVNNGYLKPVAYKPNMVLDYPFGIDNGAYRPTNGYKLK